MVENVVSGGPAAINARLHAVRRFYREGERRNIFSFNPAMAVPTLRVSKQPKGRALSADEANKLRDAAPTSGNLLEMRDRVAIDLGLLTGARSSEL